MAKKKDGQNPASVRINNRKSILNIIRNSETVTVSRIAKEIQLSKTTLWKVMDHFIEQELIINMGKDMSSDEPGKKADLYRFNSSYAYAITIAIYEKTLLLALADSKARIFFKESVHLNEDESLEIIISTIADFIHKWQNPENLPHERQKSRLIGIAIASSGVIDFQKGSCYTASRYHSWPVEAPIKEMILKEVDIEVPFYIDNYNRFYAFAEKTLGPYENEQNIIDIVTTDGGLGAGIMAEGKLKRGPQYLTGEIGHTRLNPNHTIPCHCGGYGCFEQMVDCRLLAKKAVEEKESHKDSIIYNSEVTLQGIFDASNKGDSWARELLDGVIKWFAIGIQNVILVFSPEVVIISGDYRTAGPYFLETLQEQIEKISLIRMKKNIRIEYSRFDEEGSILGAASYVIHEYFNNIFGY